MNIRACKVDFTMVPIDELNKALAFYYGKSTYITDTDGGVLYSDVHIDDTVIIHLTELIKSPQPSQVIDGVSSSHEYVCCQMHQFAVSDIELESSTLILGNYSIECIHLIKLIYSQMANSYFATQHISVPNVIEIKHLQAAGYFEKFPTQAMIAATLPLAPDQVQNFIRQQKVDPSQALEYISYKQYALNPVACYHVYSQFPKLYKKYQGYRFTIEGKAHRYEGKNKENGRLIEFNMAEIVFLERESKIVSVQELIQFYKDFFELLRLPIVFKTSSDAFFTIDAKFHAKLQERTASKIELICNLNNTNLAIGSINTHYDYFSKRFELEKSYDIISTKCTGIGIERLLMSLYSYHAHHVKELLIHAYSSLHKDYPSH